MQVRSKDGSTIHYWRQGKGEPLICIGGSLDDGTENQPVAEALAADFDVINYSRRGRGASTDRVGSTLLDELNDLQALATLVAAPPHLFGVSSGGVLALRAALAGMRIGKVVVYEAPFDPYPGAAERQIAYVQRLNAYLDVGDNDGALANFMRLAGSSEEEIASGPSHPMWQRSASLAPSLRHDADVMGDMVPLLDTLRTLDTPVLLMTGGTVPMFEQAADALADATAQSERRVLTGQGHVADPGILATEITKWLKG